MAELAQAPHHYPHVHIEASRGWVPIRLQEIWVYRELLYFLVWRDIKIRYKQTVLGAAWAIIQPFFTMVVFSLFFGRLAGISSDGIPSEPIYGDGNAGERIADMFASSPISIMKRITY